MPWPHCGDPAINDDSSCPTCGMTKEEWTIKVQVTRVLRVGKGFSWKFELKDAAGEYVQGARWRLALAHGQVEEGALTSGGYGKVTSKLPGDAVLSFPDHGAAVTCSTPEARPGAAPGEFVCPPSKDKYEFQVVASSWVEVGLRDPWGDPCAGEPYVVRLADGSLREGRLDAAGLARVEGVPGVEADVRFPERDRLDALADAFVEVELLDEQGRPVPDEAFEVRLGSGEMRTGRTDAEGRARIEGLCGTEVAVTFPDREPPAWGDVGHFELPDEVEDALEPLDLELLDAWGRPAAHEPFELRRPDGRVDRGALDRNGRARVWVEGEPEVTFPARDGEGWRRVGEPAPARLEVALVDEAGRPVPREPFVVQQDGREVFRGRLGRDGRRSVGGLGPGPAFVSFPDRPDDAWSRELAPAPPPPPPPPPRWLEVALVDPAGQPVARERYEARLPDGSVLTGRLDGRGEARLLVGADPAACEVRFPARDPRGWRRHPDQAEPAAPWLELELNDPWGRPVAREPFEVRLPGGEVVTGRLDRQGRRRVHGVPAGAACEVTFPGLDPAAWARA